MIVKLLNRKNLKSRWFGMRSKYKCTKIILFHTNPVEFYGRFPAESLNFHISDSGGKSQHPSCGKVHECVKLFVPCAKFYGGEEDPVTNCIFGRGFLFG